MRTRHNLGAFNILKGSQGASPAASTHPRAHKAPTYPPTPRLRPRHPPSGPALGQACLLCPALGGASKIAMNSKKKLFGGI